MVRHDFPTPPPPTTTSLYSRRNCGGLAWVQQRGRGGDAPWMPLWMRGRARTGVAGNGRWGSASCLATDELQPGRLGGGGGRATGRRSGGGGEQGRQAGGNAGGRADSAVGVAAMAETARMAEQSSWARRQRRQDRADGRRFTFGTQKRLSSSSGGRSGLARALIRRAHWLLALCIMRPRLHRKTSAHEQQPSPPPWATPGVCPLRGHVSRAR